MSHDYQVCPSCGDEFTLSVSECGECGVALVPPGSLPPEPSAEEFPSTDELECVRVGPLPWTRALSDALTQAGIGHRVEPDSRSEEEGGVDPRRFGGEDLFGTWVRSEDLVEAKGLDSEIFAVFEAEEAPLVSEDEACPACGAPLAAEIHEGPDCGHTYS